MCLGDTCSRLMVALYSCAQYVTDWYEKYLSTRKRCKMNVRITRFKTLLMLRRSAIAYVDDVQQKQS